MSDGFSGDAPNGLALSSKMEGINHPGVNDVMFGRGGETNYHIGNHRFRILADAHREDYRGASRKDKAIVVEEVVSIWRGRGGRFLAKTVPENGDASLWHDVGNDMARKKAAKILSEKASKRQQQNEGNSNTINMAGTNNPTARSTTNTVSSTTTTTTTTTNSNEDSANSSRKRQPENTQDHQERSPKIRAATGNQPVASGSTAMSAGQGAALNPYGPAAFNLPAAAAGLARASLTIPASVTGAATGRGIGLGFAVEGFPQLSQLPASLTSSTASQLAQLRAGLSSNRPRGLPPLDLLRLRDNLLATTALTGAAVNLAPLLNTANATQLALVANALVQQGQQSRAQQILANAVHVRNLHALAVSNRLEALIALQQRQQQGNSSERLLQALARQAAAALEESKSNGESPTSRNSNSHQMGNSNNSTWSRRSQG